MTTTSTILPIDIGASPNDGTGDNIRDAFNKANINFELLYSLFNSTVTNGIRILDLLDTPKDYSTGTALVGNGPILLGVNNGGYSYVNRVLAAGDGITIDPPTDGIITISATAGPSGSGPIGYTGSVGYTGSQGIQGPVGGGPSGSGPIGYTGSMGYYGSVGYTGSMGYYGSIGYTGSQSTTIGYTGSVGYTGSRGTQGPSAVGAVTGSGSSGQVAYWNGASSIIGSSSFTFDGFGNVTASDFIVSSDKRLKDIAGNIAEPLKKLQSINGIVFRWNDLAKEKGITNTGDQLGVIAQEIKEVAPEAVFEDNGYLKVSYDKLIPILIEAIKEVNKKVDLLLGEK